MDVGESSANHSLPALSGSARTKKFHYLGKYQYIVAQQAATTVDERSLTIMRVIMTRHVSYLYTSWTARPSCLWVHCRWHGDCPRGSSRTDRRS